MRQLHGCACACAVPVPVPSGQFELGEMHGLGVLTMANGDRFEGTMEHSRMQGGWWVMAHG